MNILQELRALLRRKAVTLVGPIVENTENGFRVQTRTGVVFAVNGTSTALKVGNHVIIREGVIIGRCRNPLAVPRYHL
jgi:hypothetical protein